MLFDFVVNGHIIMAVNCEAGVKFDVLPCSHFDQQTAVRLHCGYLPLSVSSNQQTFTGVDG